MYKESCGKRCKEEWKNQDRSEMARKESIKENIRRNEPKDYAINRNDSGIIFSSFIKNKIK